MCLGVVFCHCQFNILLCDGLTAFLHCQQRLTFSLFTMLSYTTLQAQCPSGWLSNMDALGSVEQEYRLVSWSTFTTGRDYGTLCSGWVMGFTSEPQRQPPAAVHKEATPVSSETSTNAKVLQLK